MNRILGIHLLLAGAQLLLAGWFITKSVTGVVPHISGRRGDDGDVDLVRELAGGLAVPSTTMLRAAGATTKADCPPAEQGGEHEKPLEARTIHEIKKHGDDDEHSLNHLLIDETSGVDASATCDDLLHLFHRLMDDYRRTPHKISSSSSNTTVHLPVINYAYYANQGFGRLLGHTALHCLFALTILRPCVVDLTDRDPHYTWQSFYTQGTYEWNMVGPAETYLPDVQTAVLAMANKGDDHWDKRDPEGPPRLDHLACMIKNQSIPSTRNPHQYWSSVQHWRPEHQPTQALLSPNWGTSWFTRFKIPDTLGGCDKNDLLARIQNALWRPTSLAVALHDQRARLVLPSAKRRHYGALHVRTWFLKPHERQYFSYRLEPCLKALRETQGVDTWWILSDDAAFAEGLTHNITTPGLTLKHAYILQGVEADRNFIHSNSDAATGMFGHRSMAASVLDWMVLYESSVALIIQSGFGETGARGNGKYERYDTPRVCQYPLKLFM